MWKVIYVASSHAAAVRIRDALTREGLLVQMRPVGGSQGSGPVELLVPQVEAREALEILTDILRRAHT